MLVWHVNVSDWRWPPSHLPKSCQLRYQFSPLSDGQRTLEPNIVQFSIKEICILNWKLHQTHGSPPLQNTQADKTLRSPMGIAERSTKAVVRPDQFMTPEPGDGRPPATRPNAIVLLKKNGSRVWLNQVCLAVGRQAYFHQSPWRNGGGEWANKWVRECTAQNTHTQTLASDTGSVLPKLCIHHN